jgi:hypothetical protein
MKQHYFKTDRDVRQDEIASGRAGSVYSDGGLTCPADRDLSLRADRVRALERLYAGAVAALGQSGKARGKRTKFVARSRKRVGATS